MTTQQFFTADLFFDFYPIFGPQNGLVGSRNLNTPAGKLSRDSPGVDGFKIGLVGGILWSKMYGDFFQFSSRFLL